MLLHVNCLLISSLDDYYESDFFILNGMIRLCLVHDNGGNYELNFNIKGNASVEYYYVTIRFPHSKQVHCILENITTQMRAMIFTCWLRACSLAHSFQIRNDGNNERYNNRPSFILGRKLLATK